MSHLSAPRIRLAAFFLITISFGFEILNAWKQGDSELDPVFGL